MMSTGAKIKSYLKVPKISNILKARPLQTHLCEQPSFCPPSPLETLEDIKGYVSAHDKANVYVVDFGESDFGSRANFGRGHNHEVLAAGCPTSFDSLLSRLGNSPVNKLNTAFADSLCVLGSVSCQDLALRCKDFTASIPEERSVLIECVREARRRGTAILTTVFQSVRPGHAQVYLVNGDHDHMTTAVGSLYAVYKVKPVVINVDLHADARPSEDGPHSGTWCSEIFESEWARTAYCVGLNPLSNSQSTINNLDQHGVVYSPYTWDRLKSGDVTLAQAAHDITDEILDHALSSEHPGGELPPIILSICGDSVLGLPSSAGTDMVGYSVDDVYAFIAGICRRVPVSCLTVAEAKTSLNPHRASCVGEFLTQTLFLYQLSHHQLI